MEAMSQLSGSAANSGGCDRDIRDVFLPYRYPKWFMSGHLRFWNENYLVGMMLHHTKDWFVMMACCPLTFTRPDLIHVLASAMD